MLRAIYTLSLALALAVALAATLSAAPASAQARNGNPLIRQGQQQYDDLEFEQALQTLSAALIRAGNSADENATVYRLLAYTYLALGREEEAAGAYRGLLALRPDTTPGTELAPQTRTFFEGVKQSWESDGRPGYQARPPAPVTIRHRSPAQAERGNAVALEATVDDADARVRTLVVAFHQGASESGDREVFQRLEATREGETFRATLPASVVAPPLVEYYLEALDANGLPVAGRLGRRQLGARLRQRLGRDLRPRAAARHRAAQRQHRGHQHADVDREQHGQRHQHAAMLGQHPRQRHVTRGGEQRLHGRPPATTVAGVRLAGASLPGSDAAGGVMAAGAGVP